MLNILILGNGAREKVIAEKLKPNIILNSQSTNFNEILNYSIQNKISLVIPSTEYYLCNGIVDFLKQHNIYCFGPSVNAAKIEKSKEFSKKLMKKYNIPTANARIFNDREKHI